MKYTSIAGHLFVDLNGRKYEIAERGRLEAALLYNGEMIAYTAGESAVMLSGIREDVALWAESYELELKEA